MAETRTSDAQHERELTVTEPADGVVLPFPDGGRKRRTPKAAKPLPIVIPDPEPTYLGFALFDVPFPNPTVRLPAAAPAVPTSSGKPRAKASPQRPRAAAKPRSTWKPPEPQTPEGKRALEIARSYKANQPVCNVTRVAEAIETAVGTWPDEEIVAAVERLLDSPYGVTPNTLNYQLRKGAPTARQVDPVIHQAVDAALEHLGRLDSETMTETEKTLAAAVRQLAVAVMHAAAAEPGANPA
jgi:hypothetical protein